MKQKRQFMQHLLLMLGVLMSAASAKAANYDFKAENSDGVTIYYKVIGKNAAVTCPPHPRAYKESSICIPKFVSYNGKKMKITKISWDAFQNSKISTISLPNTIDTIEGSAFFRCYELKAIEIPSSVKSIGGGAFTCSGITSIYIPANVKSIGLGILSDCKVKSITVDKKNKYYDSREGCNCIIETATNTLVAGCQNSQIPNGVEIIQRSAFEKAEISKVFIPNSVKRIERNAFLNSKISKLSLSNSLTYIGEKAFSNCYKLDSVVLTNNIDTIETQAFYLTKLKTINIPASVRKIGKYAFCVGLYGKDQDGGLKISVAANNNYYDSRNDCNAIIETSTNTLLLGSNNTRIPNDIAVIEDCAFPIGFNGTIPNSVIAIGLRAFQGGSIVNIPNNVWYIGDLAFYGCEMTEIHIPAANRYIGKRAFEAVTGVKSITIDSQNNDYQCPDSTNAIFSGATIIKGCRNTDFEKIKQKKGTFNIGAYSFSEVFKEELTTTEDSVHAALLLPEGVVNIGESAFKYCESLLTVWIPSSVKSLGRNAFDMGYKYKNKKDPNAAIVSFIEEPFAIDISVFENSKFGVLRVPKGAKEKYEQTSGWNQFDKIEEHSF